MRSTPLGPERYASAGEASGGNGEFAPFHGGDAHGVGGRNIVTLGVAYAVIAGAGTVATINAVTASAAAPTPPFNQCPAVGAANSCNILIELDNTGATILDDSSQPPFDGAHLSAR